MAPTRSVDWAAWSEDGDPSGSRGWSDLTHPLDDALPSPEYFPQPCIRRLMTLPGDPLNLTRVELMCHYGTHLDAPNHVIEDGPGIDRIPLRRLWGPGMVIGVDAPADAAISAETLAAARPGPEPGDLVVIDTGWSRCIGSARYHQHPYLSVEAARWLVERQVGLVALDVVTPDLPIHLREAGFDFPVHRLLLGAGVLIVENVRPDPRLRDRRIEMMVQPLPLVDADGSPARVWARPAEPGRSTAIGPE